MYTGNTYMLLFFIYGLAFFSMGISAFQQRTLKDTNFPLLTAIKQLGYFGITHGLVEWLLMIIIWNQYPQYNLLLLANTGFLSAISFTFLWSFGIKLFEEKLKLKSFYKKLPLLALALWALIYLFLYISNKNDIIQNIQTMNVLSRYFIAFPGGITAGVGLYKNGKTIYNLKLKKVSIKFKVLA